ncbi:MAG: trypsin-like serine protease [Bdellovibrionales bacterium]
MKKNILKLIFGFLATNYSSAGFFTEQTSHAEEITESQKAQSSVTTESQRTFIVHGTPVSETDPIGKSTVALYIFTKNPQNQNEIHNYCSGTLVSPNIVMTAAHCIADYAADESKTIEYIRDNTRIGFGLPVVHDLQDSRIEFRSITSVIVHPQYIVDPTNSLHVKYDMTLLKLNAPAPATAVSAKLVSDRELIQSGLNIVLAGFGKIDGVKKIPATQVMRTTVKIDKGYYSPTQFTYKALGGHASCHGDSGGPAYLDNNSDQPFVVGVASWGDQTCEEMGVYTSVPAMYNWIIDTISKWN